MRAFSALSVFIAIGAVSAVPALTSVNSTTTASSTTDKAYIPVVWNKTAIIPSFGPIHGLPIQARDGDFWVGGNASALCPPWDTNCPSQNTTIISQGGNRTMWMGILDSYGQQIVSGDGRSLQYTLPRTHSQLQSGIPWGQSFDVDYDDYSNETVMRFEGNDFVACQIYTFDPSQIVIKPLYDIVSAYEFGNCTPIKFQLEETTAPAVEYYHGSCCEPCTEYYYGPDRYPVILDPCYDDL